MAARSLAFGGVTTISVGTPAGGTVVGALAPTLVAEFGWRGTFVAVGAGTMLMVILIVAVLRESPSHLLGKGKTQAAHAVAAKVLDGEFELVAEHHAGDREGGTIGVFHPSNFRLNLGVGIAFAAAAMVAYAMLNWGTTFLTAKGSRSRRRAMRSRSAGRPRSRHRSWPGCWSIASGRSRCSWRSPLACC